MLPPAQRRAIAIMAGVLLAGLLILMPATRANAQGSVNCTDPILSGVKADATLDVDGANRSYPHLTATTKYEIPPTWSGTKALLGSHGDKEYESALQCFLARWPFDKVLQLGEYRPSPPVVQVTPAKNGKEGTPPLVVLHDVVTGDLTSHTAPPFLGPWDVTLNSDNLQLQLIDKKTAKTTDYQNARPKAFDSTRWTVHVHLVGLHFHHLEPTPALTDGEKEALWEFPVGATSGQLRIGVELDIPAHMAIASDSGPMAAVSNIMLALVDAIFYGTLLILLYRHQKALIATSTAKHGPQSQVPGDVRAACWISALGLTLGIFRAAAYWSYGKAHDFDGLGMPPAYWKWSGLTSIWTVGLIISIISFRMRRALPTIFGLLLILYGTAVLLYPEYFGLSSEDFSPRDRKVRSPWLWVNIIHSGGGQLALMTLLTCAVLFVTITALHFTAWSLWPPSAPDAKKDTSTQRWGNYRIPSRKFLALSLLASLALMSQWIFQQVELWNRTHVFPAIDGDRSSQLIGNVTTGMVTYYLDLFTELATNSVPWVAIAAIIFMLYRLGRGTPNPQPSSAGEYRLLGILFAAVVVRTESWYFGFPFRITFAVALVIVGFTLPWVHRLPWARRFYPLRTICLRRENEKELPEDPELHTMLPGPTDLPDLRARLFDQQAEMDRLRERARNLAAELPSEPADFPAYEIKKQEIESSLDKRRFLTGLRQPTELPEPRGPVDQWKLPWNVRPVDVALAIGPGVSWWENGVRGAQIGAFLGAPATIYFSYTKTESGKIGAFDSHLGLLRLLCSVIWESGFWVIAAFVLGCLWTSLPGRRWPVKGTVLWAGFAIPFAVDFILGQEILHQGVVAEQSLGLPTGEILRLLLLLFELCLVGLVFDWLTFRDADRLRIRKWRLLATLYGVRELVPTLAEAVVPLLASLIGIYIQYKSPGAEQHGILQPPASPRNNS